MVLLSVVSVAGISGILAALLVIAERYLANYGECKIDINQGNKVLTVQGGASLLSSLARAKIFLPSACGGRGTCGYCKCKVVEGVDHCFRLKSRCSIRKNESSRCASPVR